MKSETAVKAKVDVVAQGKQMIPPATAGAMVRPPGMPPMVPVGDQPGPKVGKKSPSPKPVMRKPSGARVADVAPLRGPPSRSRHAPSEGRQVGRKVCV